MDGKFEDPLMRLLFGSSDKTLRNLKLLRGDATGVTEQELRDEVHSALLQVQMGDAELCKTFQDLPDDHQVSLDKLRELI